MDVFLFVDRSLQVFIHPPFCIHRHTTQPACGNHYNCLNVFACLFIIVLCLFAKLKKKRERERKLYKSPVCFLFFFFFCTWFNVTSAPRPCSVKTETWKRGAGCRWARLTAEAYPPLTCIWKENTQAQRENQKRWEESREIKEMRLGVRWKRGEGLDGGRMSADEDGWHCGGGGRRRRRRRRREGADLSQK